MVLVNSLVYNHALTREVKDVLRPLIKLFFLASASLEVAREKIEDAVDSFTARAGEAKSSGSEHFQETKDKVKEMVSECTQNIWQRSDVLESHVAVDCRDGSESSTCMHVVVDIPPKRSAIDLMRSGRKVPSVSIYAT